MTKKAESILCALALVACGKNSPTPSPSVESTQPAAVAPDEPDEDEDVDGSDRILMAEVDHVEAEWLRAQNAGDFDAYIALYGAAFTGVRRTADGKETKLDLAGWKADRQKMFKNKIEVASEGGSVLFDDSGPIKVTFLQRWRSGKYADHGQKVLTIDVAGGDAKIVREEMLWSKPGWDDAKDDPIDAASMQAPITLRLSSKAGSPNGDCRDHELVLHVKDAAGVEKTVAIGSTTDAFLEGVNDGPAGKVTYLDPAKSKKALYTADGVMCGGLAVSLKVQQRGDAIMVVEDWQDDESAKGAGTEQRFAVALPPGAAVTAK